MNFLKMRMNVGGVVLLILLLGISPIVELQGQPEVPKKAYLRYTSTALPVNYEQVGNTSIYYKYISDWYGSPSAIDVYGYFEGLYYGSTYGDNGYRVALQVNENYAQECLEGATIDGVTFRSSVEQQGELARISYVLSNTTESDVVVSLGVHADVMIGNNDRAPIRRKKDMLDNTYGLAMLDGNGAQLCVLFGSGLAGVTAVSDFWFGHYSLNSSAYAMVGHYSSGSYYMVENGSYDSGMGWCWKNRSIPAGQTVVFSYLMGVGEVNLEPNSNFAVTPDDPAGWNDLTRPHRLTLEGDYESPAGLDGRIEYAVEESEEWIPLTEMMPSGSSFTGTLTAQFDMQKATHVIRFRTVDNVGNATLLPSIIYKDVSHHEFSGITDFVYTGDSLFQTGVSSDLADDEFLLTNYQHNVNAGTASFDVEGVFPATIGRRTYTFSVIPASLQGEIILTQTEFVYNGLEQTPSWRFSNEAYASLEETKDYAITYKDNRYPGSASLQIQGKGNYQGTLSATFTIDKAPLLSGYYELSLPNEDITYDGLTHPASVSFKQDGVGEVSFFYTRHGETDPLETVPCEEGSYDIYCEIADGSYYYGQARDKVGAFTIYHLDEEEWATLQTIHDEMVRLGWNAPWDLAQGAQGVSQFHGVTVEKGQIVQLDLSGAQLSGSFPLAVFDFPHLRSLDLSDNRLEGDLSERIAGYLAQHPTKAQRLKTLSIAQNRLEGNIGVVAGCFPNLETLIASHNAFDQVNPTVSSTVHTLELGCQTIEKVIDWDMSQLSIEDWSDLIPNILLYDHAHQTYRNEFRMLSTTADLSTFDKETCEEWATEWYMRDGALSFPFVSLQNAYQEPNGAMLNVLFLHNDGSVEGSSFRVKLFFESGDANFDGHVNILDLQTVLNFMFEEYLDKPFNFTASNLWEDEQMNVQDVVCIVNKLLDATDVLDLRSATDDLTSQEASLCMEEGRLVLRSAVPVSAFDIVLRDLVGSFSVAADLRSQGFLCEAKRMDDQIHLIGYSLSGATLPVGEYVLGESIAGCVHSAMLSDTQAHVIGVQLNKSLPTNNLWIEQPNQVSYQNHQLVFQLNEPKTDLIWSVYALNGQMVLSGKEHTLGGTLCVPATLSKGCYIVRLHASNGFEIVEKLTITE